MKRTIYTTLMALYVLGIYAQSPKWAKKARPSQVSVIAYSTDGNMKETQGVFTGQDGTIITEYDALKGAQRILVIDNQGNEYNVTEICGANAMYNVTRLRVDLPAKSKITCLPLAEAAAPEGSVVYTMPNAKADKKALCQTDTVKKAEKFKETFNYYTLSAKADELLTNSPVMNEAGEMIGILQMPAKEGKPAFAIDAQYITSLKVGALDASNQDLNSILIKKALPEKEEEAATFIFLSAQKDTINYIRYVEDFITRFPASTQGYVMKAEHQVSKGDYAEAQKTYESALANDALAKDELHYSWATMLYRLNTRTSYNQYEDWSLDKALEQATKASEANPLPAYTNQIADCLYALKRYDEAAEKYMSLTNTNLRTPNLFMFAYQCKQEAKAPQEELLALLDSAINCYPKPYPTAAANTIIIRANELAKAGKNREAVAGYNDYEHLTGGNLTANFYYGREQLEVKCRMYPAALNDIEKAIKLSPNEPILYAECAALNFRVNQIDDAITYAKKAIEIDNQFADPHRILGVCYNQKGNKQEAKKYLQKAVELGDQMAGDIISKIQ